MRGKETSGPAEKRRKTDQSSSSVNHPVPDNTNIEEPSQPIENSSINHPVTDNTNIE